LPAGRRAGTGDATLRTRARRIRDRRFQCRRSRSMNKQDVKRHGSISSWSIRRPVGTLMLTSVVLVLGFFFLSGLPLDLLPHIVYPQIRAGVNNPGVEPEVLEETVAKPLEAALATTENVTAIETEIQEG